MATVTFLQPTNMIALPFNPGASQTINGNSNEIDVQHGTGLNMFIYGSFAFVQQTGALVGTITHVSIDTADSLLAPNLDIAGLSYTTNVDIIGQTGSPFQFVANLLSGDDTFIPSSGADGILGFDGLDTVSYAGAAAGVLVSVANPAINSGEAAGDTYGGIEIFELSAHNDTFYGGAGQNIAFGGGGTDLLLIDVGLTLSNDYFYGEDGADSLYGGPLVDQLSGGAGPDIYNYENFFDGGGAGDLVTDFEHGVDRFYLYTDPSKHSPFQGAPGAALSDGVNFISGPSPLVTTDVGTMLYYTGLGTLTWDPDGTGPQGQVLIANVPLGTNITSADFLFV